MRRMNLYCLGNLFNECRILERFYVVSYVLCVLCIFMYFKNFKTLKRDKTMHLLGTDLHKT